MGYIHYRYEYAYAIALYVVFMIVFIWHINYVGIKYFVDLF